MEVSAMWFTDASVRTRSRSSLRRSKRKPRIASQIPHESVSLGSAYPGNRRREPLNQRVEEDPVSEPGLEHQLLPLTHVGGSTKYGGARAAKRIGVFIDREH